MGGIVLLIFVIIIIISAITRGSKNKKEMNDCSSFIKSFSQSLSKGLSRYFLSFWETIEDKEQFIADFSLDINKNELFIYYSSLYYVSVIPNIQSSGIFTNPIIGGGILNKLPMVLIDDYIDKYPGGIDKLEYLKMHGELSSYLEDSWREYTGEQDALFIYIAEKAYKYLIKSISVENTLFYLHTSVVISNFTNNITDYLKESETLFDSTMQNI